MNAPPERSENMTMSDILQRWRYELCESLRFLKEAIENGSSRQEVRMLVSQNGENTNLYYSNALALYKKLTGRVNHDASIALGRLMNFPSSLFVPIDSGELELGNLVPIIDHVIGMLDRNAAMFEEEKLRDLPAIIQGMCDFFDREIQMQGKDATRVSVLDVMRALQKRLSKTKSS